MTDLRQKIVHHSPELCKEFGIKRLSLFGSVARGEETTDSDIDFFAEFENPSPETMPDRYFGFVEEAGRRFNRRIQLLTPRMVRNPFFKRAMERDLVKIYAHLTSPQFH